MKILCSIFGCKWRYNFVSLPNKCICERCKKKEKLDMENLQWCSISEFKDETRSDDDLIKKWNRRK